MDQRRRGMATGELVLVLLSATVIGGLGVVIVPQAIEASTRHELEVVEPTDDGALQVFNRVRMLFGSCEGVIGVWAREGGGVDVGLWHGDVRDPGVVGSDEVVLVSFSPVMGSLAAYLEVGHSGPELQGVVIEGDEKEDLGASLSGAELSRADFPDWWRARPGTERHVIAGDLAGMRVVRGGPAGGGEGLETLRVELLWGSGSSDVVVEKGVFEVAVRCLDTER